MGQGRPFGHSLDDSRIEFLDAADLRIGFQRANDDAFPTFYPRSGKEHFYLNLQ
jgi:hypothetical protein